MIDIRHGDCIEQMRAMEDACVDAIVTDPPYELGFMGKGWDSTGIANSVEMWREALRVLKPGGHLLAFSATRTQHRMVCAIEDAGFEVRDCIRSLNGQDHYTAWAYGTGFPKGLNVVNNLIRLALCQSKDRARLAAQCSVSTLVSCDGAKERIVVALAQILPEGGLALITEIGGAVGLHVPTDMWPSEWMTAIGLNTTWSWNGSLDGACDGVSKSITETTSETTIDLKTWNWLIGLHTSANTTPCSAILPNGSPWPAVSAALNLNGGSASKSDIPIVTALGDATYNPVVKFSGFNVCLKPAWEPICVARKPLIGTVAANVLEHGTGALNIDGCRVGTEDKLSFGSRQIGDGIKYNPIAADRMTPGERHTAGRWPANVIHDGSDEVLAAFAAFGEKKTGSVKPYEYHGGKYSETASDAKVFNSRQVTSTHQGDDGTAARFFYSSKASKADRAGSSHPTVKPLSLMRYLCKLVTPPGGTVLDMFAGSGTTLQAALEEGFHAIGIEQSAEYVNDIRRRIDLARGDMGLFAAE
jgi:hypothetical protein